MSASGKNRGARDMKVADAMHRAVLIDDALRRVSRHARGADMMAARRSRSGNLLLQSLPIDNEFAAAGSFE